MKYYINENVIIFDNGREVTFDFSVKQALYIEGVVVVVLEVPSGKKMTENVFGVSPDGDILWQIPRLKETATCDSNRYMDVRIDAQGSAVVGNWNGMDVYIDAVTGQVKNMEFTK